MDTSTGEDGTEHRPPNPILVAFIQEVRRLAEEVTRREEAAASQSDTEDADTEEGNKGRKTGP
jgi:hypothetical protein